MGENRTKYLFEKNGKWLTNEWSMTDNALEAMMSNNEIEANLFLMGRQEQGLLCGFVVTEHEFVD